MPDIKPQGPSDANIMIVGAAPTKRELEQGKPFLGQNGDLLGQVIRASGFRREQVYLTTVIKDRLPPWDNKKRAAFYFHDEHPTQVLMDGVMGILDEVQKVRPNVVVPMGDIALWTMMQHQGIGKWRGSIIESNLIEGQKVVPTFHPAFFISSRNMWHQQPLMEWDFARATRESTFPEIHSPDYNFIVDPSPAEIEAYTDLILKQPEVTCDTEWYGPNKLAYIGFAWNETDAITIPNTSMAAQRAYRAILNSGIPIIMQNASFDVPALYRQGIEVKNLADDTMVAWNCCWASIRKKGLDMLCSVLTEQPYYKDEVEFVGQDDELGQIYCATDCVVTHKSMLEIRKSEFPTTNGDIGYGITMSAMPYFLEASKTGIRIDDDLRREMKDIHLAKADELENALGDTIGYTINCRSPQQIAKLVFDQLLPMYGIKRTKRTTKQDYLMDIAGSTHVEAVQLILGSIIRVRQNRNIVSRYLHDGILDIDGRVRTNWNLAGTRSGRFSSTIPWWPGLAFQTVPEDARAIFIADPGHVFIGFDYEQAEARIVAMLTYNHDLLDDMRDGVDIHTKLASQLPFGKTYEELIAEIAEVGKDECRERHIAKKSRHAFNYVEGADTFALHLNREWIDTGIGINRGEARRIRENYLELNPGLEPWWGTVRQNCYDHGYIDNSFGRRRYVTGRITDEIIREMVSYEPQSTIADLCTQAIVKMCKAMPWASVLSHMHDGAYFQVPEDRWEEAFQIMMELSTWPIRANNELITVPAEGKVGRSWGGMGKSL